jgi:hypothetical protein
LDGYVDDLSEQQIIDIVKSYISLSPIMENSPFGHQTFGELDLVYHLAGCYYAVFEVKASSSNLQASARTKARRQLSKYLSALKVLRPTAKFLTMTYDPFTAFQCHECPQDKFLIPIRDKFLRAQPLVPIIKCSVPRIEFFDIDDSSLVNFIYDLLDLKYLEAQTLNIEDVSQGTFGEFFLLIWNAIINIFTFCLPIKKSAPIFLQPQSKEEENLETSFGQMQVSNTTALSNPIYLTYCDEPLMEHHISVLTTKYLYYGGYFGKPYRLEGWTNRRHSIWELRTYIHQRCLEENINKRCLFEQFVRYVRRGSDMDRRNAVRTYRKLGERINNGSAICCSEPDIPMR